MDYTNLHTPTEMAEARIRLASEYSRMSEEMATILALKPSIWLALRANTKSDTSAERAWENTEQGIKEAQLKLRLRANDKMQSALSSRIRIAELEAKQIL